MKKRIGFFPAHPSQLWMMVALEKHLNNDVKILWFLRSKDCMVELADGLNLKYEKISIASNGIFGNAIELFLNIFRVVRATRRNKIDLWFSKYGAVNIAAKLMGVKSISFNDDDADIIPMIAWTSYPFAEFVLVPSVTRMGRFENKAIRYKSCHELFYLHPDRFKPDRHVLAEHGIGVSDPYVLIRLSGLNAHHDVGITGVDLELLDSIINYFSGKCRIIISSERVLDKKYEAMRMAINVLKMHHLLAFSRMLIGDSQTMTMEAAVLGVPSVRISDFVGKLSAIEKMEQSELSYGIQPGNTDLIMCKVKEIYKNDNIETYKNRRDALLEEYIDPVTYVADKLQET